MSQEKEMTISVCPFCGGKPELIHLPGAYAVGCLGCGCLGPAAGEADFPGRADSEAVNLWKRRGGVGNTRIAAVKPGTSADTCITAENLMKQAEKLYDNEFGNVSMFVLFMIDPETKRLGIVKHRLDDIGMKTMLEEVLRGIVGPGGPLDPRRQHAGLILPGR